MIETPSPDSHFYRTAVYDPARKSVTRIPLKFEGDIWTPGWTSDGRISARGARLFSSLWRYQLR